MSNLRSRFAALVTLLLLLAACGNAPAAPSADQPTAASASEATSAPAPTAAPEPTIRAEEVTITYAYPVFSAVPKNQQAVEDAINAVLKPKINAIVKLNPIDFGAYNEKVNLAYASGEPYDLAFTASWANDYYANVRNGNLLALDELLPKYAPNLWASMDPKVWDAARYQGKIYAVINQQIFPSPYGIYIRDDLAKKYNFDLNSVNDYADLEPFLAAVKAGEPDVTPIFSDDTSFGPIADTGQYAYFDAVVASLGVKVDDPTATVQNLYELPETRQLFDLVHKWYMAGYYTKDPLPGPEAQAALNAGKYAVRLHRTKPGGDVEFNGITGYTWQMKQITKPFLATSPLVTTLTGVSAQTQHPEVVVQFLELLNSDKELYNLLAKGMAGQDYTVVDETTGVIDVPEDSGYNLNTDWMFGNQFNAFYIDPGQVGSWEATAQLNREAAISPLLGFVFDREPVKDELAQIDAVTKEACAGLTTGTADPAVQLPECIASTKDLLPKVKAELEKQIEAWKAANK